MKQNKFRLTLLECKNIAIFALMVTLNQLLIDDFKDTITSYLIFIFIIPKLMVKIN